MAGEFAVNGLHLIPIVSTFLVWVAIFTTGASTLALRQRLVFIALVAAGLLLPVLHTTAFYYLRGMFGDFSATHALWAFAALGNRFATQPIFVIPQRQKLTVALALVVLAAGFYPSALGATEFDMYRLGFEPVSLLIALAVIALLAWQLRENFLLTAIVTAVFAFRFQLLESTNLWDYLFDPLLVIYCAVWLLVTLLRFVFRRIMQRPEPAAASSAVIAQS